MKHLVFPYQQLLPVFARDVLDVDAVVWVSSARRPASAPFAGPSPSPRPATCRGRAVCSGRLVLMSLSVVGSLGRQLAGGRCTGGAERPGSAAFASLQSTIVLGHASDQLRGRDGRADPGDRLGTARHAGDRRADRAAGHATRGGAECRGVHATGGLVACACRASAPAERRPERRAPERRPSARLVLRDTLLLHSLR